MTRSESFDFEVFRILAQHLSFRAAAAELEMSPSALSHRVGMLEQRLGVRLFNRTTRSVGLTEAGEQLLARIGPALKEIAAAVEAINDFRETPAGTLRINASEGAAERLFDAVLEFTRRYPQMKVDVVSDARMLDIIAEGFDAGVRSAELVPQDMIAVPMSAAVRYAVVGTPDYFARHGVPAHPGELAHHHCIRARIPGGRVYRWEFFKQGDVLEVDVAGALTLDSSTLMIAAALTGEHLAYVSEWTVEAHLADGRLTRVLADWTPPLSRLCLYYPGHRHVPAGLKAFVALLREMERAR